MVGDDLDFIERMLRRSDEQARLEGFSNKSWHSSFYHKQYEGYSEYYEYDENGKKRLRRVYTGAYYHAALTTGRRRLISALRVMLLAAAVVLFLIGASRQAVCNTKIYVTIFQALAVLTLVWALSGVIGGLYMPEKMKIGDYKKTSVRVCRASLCSSLCLFAAAAAALVSAVLADGGFNVYCALCAALFLAAGGAMLVLNRMEAGIEYQVIDNDTPEPLGSIQI